MCEASVSANILWVVWAQNPVVHQGESSDKNLTILKYLTGLVESDCVNEKLISQVTGN